MRGLLFDPSPDAVAALRDAGAGWAQAFVTECRAISALWAQAAPSTRSSSPGRSRAS